MSVLILDTCIFHVFVQQVLQVLLLVVIELSLQSQQDVFVQQHPDQVERACQCQNVKETYHLVYPRLKPDSSPASSLSTV